MNNLKLKQLIRESINEYIKKIDEAGYIAGVKAKFDATQEAINKRKKMVELDGLDEDVQGMIDERKVKEVNNEIKALEKSLAKLQKQLDKLNAKSEKSSKVEDTEEKEIVDETSLNENRTAEELFQMFKEENLLNDRREYDVEDLMSTYPDLSREEAQKLETMLQNQIDETTNSDIYEILYMQKIAGILSETEYKAKVEEAKKMTATQKEKKEDIVKGMKKSKSFGKSKDEKAKMYATATKLATKKK